MAVALLIATLGVEASAQPASAAPNVHIAFVAQLRSETRPSCALAWGRASGLNISWSPGQSWIQVSGPPAAVARSVGVTISIHGGHGDRVSWSSHGQPKIPEAACGEIAGFGSLHSAVPLTLPALHLDAASENAGSGLTAAQMLRAYDATPLYSSGFRGQGQTIVLFEVDAYRTSDLKRFSDSLSLPYDLIAPLGNPGAVDGENDLDVETAHEIAPEAKLVDLNLNGGRFAYLSTAASFVAAFQMAQQRWPGSIWSLSIGVCERESDAVNATDLRVLEAAVSKAESTGTTAFASSGDAGGLECMPDNAAGTAPRSSWEGVSVPASLPAVTGVGGTTLVTRPNGSWLREMAWIDPLVSQGTGGGPSAVFTRPSWQAGPGLVANGNSAMRGVPDVSADADPVTGNAIIENGHATTGGGTSMAAPLWASFTALIDQYLLSQRHHEVGFFNPTLYELANTTQPYPPFHDVTIGGNDFFPATAGYDMVTGLGSPDVYNLARDLSRMGA